MTVAPILIDASGRHFECHGSLQALTRSGQLGVVLDLLTDAGGPHRTRPSCDVLVSVSGGTFDADFVLTAESADALATMLQAAATTARAVTDAQSATQAGAKAQP